MSQVKLVLGDCLDVLRDMEPGSVDAVVTDPPYGQNLLQKFGRVGTSRIGQTHEYNPIVGDDTPFDPLPFLGFPTVVMFGANWYAHRLPPSGGWLVWDKKDGGLSDNYGDGEIAWIKGASTIRIIRHKWRGMIKASEHNQRRVHPTQKPVWVMKWIIENYTQPGDTILDPFMGSGTTGVAAVQTGRRFVGIEISEEYYAIAERRIAQAQAQPPLIPHEAQPQPVQNGLYEVSA